MPLYYTETLASHCRVLLWKLEEDEHQLRALLPRTDDHTELDTISHPQKRREWLAGRVAIKLLAEEQGSLGYHGMWKDEHGKPFLTGADWPISMTHTPGYVAAVLHLSKPVGIDMEQRHPKLLRAAKKFLSESEQAVAGDQIELIGMYWCAKEALYKLNGRKQVSFKDSIHIEPFDKEATTLYGTLTDSGRQVQSSIQIRWIEDYCLAVAV